MNRSLTIKESPNLGTERVIIIVPMRADVVSTFVLPPSLDSWGGGGGGGTIHNSDSAVSNTIINHVMAVTSRMVAVTRCMHPRACTPWRASQREGCLAVTTGAVLHMRDSTTLVEESFEKSKTFMGKAGAYLVRYCVGVGNTSILQLQCGVR